MLRYIYLNILEQTHNLNLLSKVLMFSILTIRISHWIFHLLFLWFIGIVESSSSFLEKGGVIAVPTDTIYGVACLAQNPGAVERIYTIKGRHQQKPIAISVAQISDIYKWVFVFLHTSKY